MKHLSSCPALLRALCLLLLGLGALSAPAHAETATKEPLKWDGVGLLAIQADGRRKPFDTFSREALIRFSGRAEWREKNSDGTLVRSWNANELMLSLIFTTNAWEEANLILVSYRPLRVKMGLEPEQKLFSFNELAAQPLLNTLAQEGQAARDKKESVSREQAEAANVVARLQLFHTVRSGEAFTIIPPAMQSGSNKWLAPPEAIQKFGSEAMGPTLSSLRTMIEAYSARDSFQMNLAARQVQDQLRTFNSEVYPKADDLQREYFYWNLHAFDRAMWGYALAFFLLLFSGTAGLRLKLRHAGLCFCLAAVALHGTGIILRCMIGGRPPVTNMYESMVWVSFGCVLFSLLFFWRYRTHIYLLAALPVSFICLLLLSQLPVEMPSRIDPLVPVLRDNFWLTVHVLTITLGYAAFSLGAGFGHIVLGRIILRPSEVRANDPIHFWLYRILQLGVLLLVTGTILGGVWANYSWGRFWGWDPKETWAFIAAMLYIFAIHGRIAGWWTEFGLAVASVSAYAGVVMAWYGVNFVLGKGLHSYGFGVGGESYAVAFILLETVFVLTACFRRRTANTAST